MSCDPGSQPSPRNEPVAGVKCNAIRILNLKSEFLDLKSSVHLYEAHLPVADPEVSCRFYVDVVGLRFAHRDLSRDIIFLWAGDDRRSMLGLWGPTTERGREFHQSHIAFHVPLAELLIAGERLNAAGIQTQNFGGEKTTEPSVIGWMPSAQLYFRDPDGHALEFISLLGDPPNPSFVGGLSEWKVRSAQP